MEHVACTACESVRGPQLPAVNSKLLLKSHLFHQASLAGVHKHQPKQHQVTWVTLC